MVRDVNLQQRVLLTIRIARGWREADLSEIIIAPVIKELLSAEKAMAPHSSTLTWRIHGQRSLVGCSPWGREESATTEQLHFHFHALEKEMATHSSVLAWRIPWTEEPGGLPSMELHRVGHD